MPTSFVVALNDPESHALRLRCDAFAGLAVRMAALDGTETELVTEAPDTAAVLARLGEFGWLVGSPEEVLYAPSRQARDRVSGSEGGAWANTVRSRHQKLDRTTGGVLYRFRIEGAAPPVAETEAFVTEWTGMYGACALTVHPAHPLSRGLADGESAAFTGWYCRHPLSGDLLPVWTADWVKPEFGTGAVLVNPAHNRVDLQFCQSVGLPVRFALVPEGYDDSPATWLAPPFIRSGIAVRTGPDTDGCTWDEVRERYLRKAEINGLAERYTDHGLGAIVVARSAEDGTGAIVGWDRLRGTVAGVGSESEEKVALAVSPVLSVVDPRIRAFERMTVVTPSSQVDSELLAMRLLLAEPALGPAVDRAPEVVVVGKAVVASDDIPDDVLRLALLTTANALETVSVKAQQVDACTRYLDVHRGLVEREGTDGDVSAEIAKAASAIKAHLGRRDTKQAFAQLYRVQKQLSKSESVTTADLLRYRALSHALTGAPDPSDLSGTWHEI